MSIHNIYCHMVFLLINLLVAFSTLMQVKELLISHVCQAGKCKSWFVTPQMPLTTAEKIMDSHGVDHLPVVSEDANPQDRGPLIGFVDRECIAIARRYLEDSSKNDIVLLASPDAILYQQCSFVFVAVFSCRAMATKEFFSSMYEIKKEER